MLFFRYGGGGVQNKDAQEGNYLFHKINIWIQFIWQAMRLFGRCHVCNSKYKLNDIETEFKLIMIIMMMKMTTMMIDDKYDDDDDDDDDDHDDGDDGDDLGVEGLDQQLI